MKKLLMLLSVFALVFALVACGGNGGGAGGNGGGGGADAVDPILIQFAHVEPEDTTIHRTIEMFRDYVEERSGGRIQINILSDGVFGGDREAIEGVSLGVIQMAQPVTSALTSYSDDFMILDLPFMFDSRAASYYALDGELGEALNAVLPQFGLRNIGFNDNGLRQMTNNVRPINVPEDLHGVKMRVMESPVFIRMFDLLGANPVPMSFTEVYVALQQGTVDGQENGAGLILASRFNEVQRYMSLTGHVYSVNATLINNSLFESLDAELQQILLSGAAEFLVRQQRQMEAEGEAAAIDELRSLGMQVNEVSPANMQLFRDLVYPMYEEYKDRIRPELFEMAARANAAMAGN